ncbi:hypothetical protein [Nocardioides donggukensis]|uniref:Uncharacterized protein n=1 Tax=Nocardioides donggukensis TaxID=2774019 RepID=A0A927K781_9ACTN|nr:hypothetical protein [Nocardioides donggukensis]MBD8870440.1 hypothetical protein [Nocardioides donggukensis]
MTNAEQETSDDRGLVGDAVLGLSPSGYILVGWVVGLVGGLVLGNADERSSVIMGALIASIGSIMLLVGIVAQGVAIGIRSTRD